MSLERELAMELLRAPDVACCSAIQLGAFFPNAAAAMVLDPPMKFEELVLIGIISYEAWYCCLPPALGSGRTRRSVGGLGNEFESDEMLNAPEPSDIAGRRVEL